MVLTMVHYVSCHQVSGLSGSMIGIRSFKGSNWVGTYHLRTGAVPVSETLYSGSEHSTMDNVQRASDTNAFNSRDSVTSNGKLTSEQWIEIIWKEVRNISPGRAQRDHRKSHLARPVSPTSRNSVCGYNTQFPILPTKTVIIWELAKLT
jgi:hypothetical protein